MKWATILKALKAKGYKGDDSLETVKAFVTEQNINLQSADGAIDLDASFKAFKAVDVLIEDEAPAETPAPKTKSKQQQADELRNWAGGLPNANNGGEEPKPRFKSLRAVATERHVQNCKRLGLVGFDDLDMAECAAASLRLKAFGNRHYEQADNDRAIVKAATGINPNSAGVLVDPQIMQGIMYATEVSGIAPKLAGVHQMTSTELYIKRRTDVATFTHRSDNQTATGQNPGYDLVTLNAKESIALIQFPTRLMTASAENVAADVVANLVEGAARRVDKDYFLGDGGSDYGGIRGLANALTANAYVTLSSANATSLVEDDLAKLMGTVQNVNNSRLAFACSRKVYIDTLFRIDRKRSGTTLTEAMTLGNQMFGGAGSIAAYGMYPVYFCDQLPTAGTTGQKILYFGDFAGGSALGLMGGVDVRYDESVGFTSATVTWRGLMNHAVNIHGDGKTNSNGPIACGVLA
jgi:HK97 family phage major capsid protein